MNRLAKESSPYLKQHARNPVDWYPWGEEALARARREDLPIFLSSGYSACHWCHVMAHESFEDPSTAALLNAHFVPIKLDREERPDLDALYMRALLRMQGAGGWPLNLFLTPNLKPFFGGSYFPPERRFGMSSFREVLTTLSQAFRERRAEVEEAAVQLTEEVRRSFLPSPPTGLPGAEAASAATRALLSRFDSVHSGFGAAPKFPQSALLQFLLDESARTGEASLAERVFFSLRKMAAGGVRDQVGGAFHRYSVDAEWHVPHYEKMLYDNAQLAALYFHASALAKEPYFATVGREVLADLSRTMTASGGGFIAALDADSEGEEGRYYLWRPTELSEVLGAEEGAFVASLFHIGPGDALETRTLHRTLDWEEAGKPHGLSAWEAEARVARDFTRLREARGGRVSPGADTKLLTDWNALTAVAFFEGFLATEEEAYREMGLDLLHLLDRRAFSGPLLHHLFDGEAPRVPGFLSDYAYLALARWKAFEATGDTEWLSSTEDLARAALKRFGRIGGVLCETATEAGGDLLLPVREAEDGALPSSVALLAQVLRHLERHTGSKEWTRALDALLTAESGGLAQMPGAYPLLAGVAAERQRGRVGGSL